MAGYGALSTIAAPPTSVQGAPNPPYGTVVCPDIAGVVEAAMGGGSSTRLNRDFRRSYSEQSSRVGRVSGAVAQPQIRTEALGRRVTRQSASPSAIRSEVEVPGDTGGDGDGGSLSPLLYHHLVTRLKRGDGVDGLGECLPLAA